MAQSEHGPAIVEHLGTHLDEADRISRLPAHVAAYELARIEAKVTALKAKPVSKAPAPPPALAGGSRSPPSIGEDMSYEQYKRARGMS